MASWTWRLAYVGLLAATLACAANEQHFAAEDGDDNLLHQGRKLLGGGWCECGQDDCPCHLDDSWLKANKCPTCPVYGCGDCDPLKCDECKRCCDGSVLSKDRKTCDCPYCNIAGCATCDAEDCSKCVVCEQGYSLTVDRKCDWTECPVADCRKCHPLNRYECEICNPYLKRTEDKRGCVCPKCAIEGCERCNPKKCDECLDCAGNLVPSYDRKSCPTCNCTIPYCAVCDHGCYTCKECEAGYEVSETHECKATVCWDPYCKECYPYDAGRCKVCYPPYIPIQTATGTSCSCDPLNCTVPHCAYCGGKNCTECDECDVGFKKLYDGSCVVEKCRAPGCKDCCPDDPDLCATCAYGFSLSGSGYGDCGQCACDPCDAPYCETCSVDNCKACEKCKPPYVLDYDGNCVCDATKTTIVHCSVYSKADCTTCEKCDKDYAWNGTHCVCERAEVEHCTNYCPVNCNLCISCDKGLVPNYDGSECVCDPDNCTIDYCTKCDPATCSGYSSPECLECQPPLVPSYDGLSCVCGSCYVEGCENCAVPDCKTCSDKGCKPPAVIGYDGECSCPYCNIPGCDKCDPEDCDNSCEVCTPPKVPDGYGGCKCDDYAAPVEHCEKYNAETCLCEVCKVLYDLDKDGNCVCNCDANVGCNACNKETCECDDCGEDLSNVCGYCFDKDLTFPGCDWKYVPSDNGESCDVICASDSVFTNAVIASDYPVSYGCVVDLKGKEGLRPGENLPSNDTGACYAEYHTGPEPVEGQQALRKGAPAFNCICQKPHGPLTWVSKNCKGKGNGDDDDDSDDDEDNRLAFGKGCNKICAKKHKYPVHVMGNHIYGDCHNLSPFYICRVEGAGSGYNIDQLKPPQARVWNGFCMTSREASEEYDCLCADKCEHPDCGTDGGYHSARADGAVLTT